MSLQLIDMQQLSFDGYRPARVSVLLRKAGDSIQSSRIRLLENWVVRLRPDPLRSTEDYQTNAFADPPRKTLPRNVGNFDPAIRSGTEQRRHQLIS